MRKETIDTELGFGELEIPNDYHTYVTAAGIFEGMLAVYEASKVKEIGL